MSLCVSKDEADVAEAETRAMTGVAYDPSRKHKAS